jgi:hypothetical protein
MVVEKELQHRVDDDTIPYCRESELFFIYCDCDGDCQDGGYRWIDLDRGCPCRIHRRTYCTALCQQVAKPTSAEEARHAALRPNLRFTVAAHRATEAAARREEKKGDGPSPDEDGQEHVDQVGTIVMEVAKAPKYNDRQRYTSTFIPKFKMNRNGPPAVPKGESAYPVILEGQGGTSGQQLEGVRSSRASTGSIAQDPDELGSDTNPQDPGEFEFLQDDDGELDSGALELLVEQLVENGQLTTTTAEEILSDPMIRRFDQIYELINPDSVDDFSTSLAQFQDDFSGEPEDLTHDEELDPNSDSDGDGSDAD